MSCENFPIFKARVTCEWCDVLVACAVPRAELIGLIKLNSRYWVVFNKYFFHFYSRRFAYKKCCKCFRNKERSEWQSNIRHHRVSIQRKLFDWIKSISNPRKVNDEREARTIEDLRTLILCSCLQWVGWMMRREHVARVGAIVQNVQKNVDRHSNGNIVMFKRTVDGVLNADARNEVEKYSRNRENRCHHSIKRNVTMTRYVLRTQFTQFIKLWWRVNLLVWLCSFDMSHLSILHIFKTSNFKWICFHAIRLNHLSSSPSSEQ